MICGKIKEVSALGTTNMVIYEKMQDGELNVIDQRQWNPEMVSLLNYTNYLILNGVEYEMVEGRINVDEQVMELLVIAAKKP
jgi:hypothetical protein